MAESHQQEQTAGMVDPSIFAHLQSKIDEEGRVREEIRNILAELERHGRMTQSILSRAHSTPSSQVSSLTQAARESINEEIATIRQLAEMASKYPYYKYNGLWTRDVQNTIFAVVLCGWLGGFPDIKSWGQSGQDQSSGRLLTIEDVGVILQVPVNLKDRDTFHITIEEYLYSLISLVDELARLAVNSVTLGDYQRPLQISQFVKDLHAGFQVLNLKNGDLRRKSDGIKYSIKKIEDVVYDLSLRNLIPKSGTGGGS